MLWSLPGRQLSQVWLFKDQSFWVCIQTFWRLFPNNSKLDEKCPNKRPKSNQECHNVQRAILGLDEVHLHPIPSLPRFSTLPLLLHGPLRLVILPQEKEEKKAESEAISHFSPRLTHIYNPKIGSEVNEVRGNKAFLDVNPSFLLLHLYSYSPIFSLFSLPPHWLNKPFAGTLGTESEIQFLGWPPCTGIHILWYTSH